MKFSKNDKSKDEGRTKAIRKTIYETICPYVLPHDDLLQSNTSQNRYTHENIFVRGTNRIVRIYGNIKKGLIISFLDYLIGLVSVIPHYLITGLITIFTYLIMICFLN